MDTKRGVVVVQLTFKGGMLFLDGGPEADPFWDHFSEQGVVDLIQMAEERLAHLRPRLRETPSIRRVTALRRRGN